MIRTAALCGTALVLVGVVACGPGSPGSTPASGLAVATAPPPDTADPDQDAPDAASPHAPVSANSAPQDEITEALTDAGVGNPAKWAAQVVAHRPYPADDPTLTRLRAALAADHADPAVVDTIVGALKP